MQRTEPETLIVMHYHMLPGGVRSVLHSSLAALAQAGWFAGRSLQLLVGRNSGVKSFVSSLASLGLQIDVKVDSRLDYNDGPWSDRQSFQDAAAELARWLLAQARGSSLYWVHNPTLGKNPLLTAAIFAAVEKAARLDGPFRFLYHIHDFAECGRLQNLKRLRLCWQEGGLRQIYPVSDNVAFAVLNSGDYRKLISAGIPSEVVSHLPNPIALSKGGRQCSREAIAAKLEEYARVHGYRFHSERQWWTMPIRLIRRKNVIEALFLAAMAKEPVQLLVTLDANSAPEKPYAEAVKAFIRSEGHAAVVGFGHNLVGTSFSMDDLLYGSAAVVTTSFLEGFGFAFLEGPNRGRPLLGRNLSDVTEDFRGAGFPAGSLYENFMVPAPRKIRQTLADKGTRFARQCSRQLGMAQAAIEKFAAEIEALYQGDTVDLSFLDLEGQLFLARRLRDPSFIRELCFLNPDAARPVIFPADFAGRLQEQYGLEAHAQRLSRTFETLFHRQGVRQVPDDVSDRLVELYFSPQYHRPLMGDW
ncbi:MAG: hypothetical protein JRJ12_07290 [Deltaproteobacteria bacterium]|nr:hypothetical protein [Deltaproteobacteria bacterium]MBW2071234.1 hypothetical protein [Deltaproteobacteria bacterium]